MDHEARQLFCRIAAGDAHQIREVFILAIGVGQNVRWTFVHAAHVARMTAVAAAILERRGLENGYGCSRFPSRQRGTQRGIAAAYDDHIGFMMVAPRARVYDIRETYVSSPSHRGGVAAPQNPLEARRRGGRDGFDHPVHAYKAMPPAVSSWRSHPSFRGGD